MFRKQKTTKREYELHVQQSHIMDRNYKILRNTSYTHILSQLTIAFISSELCEICSKNTLEKQDLHNVVTQEYFCKVRS